MSATQTSSSVLRAVAVYATLGLGLSVVHAITPAAHAGGGGRYPIVNPATPEQLVESLTTQTLSPEQVSDLFKPGQPARSTTQPVSDLAIFSQLGIRPAPSSEGIPSLVKPLGDAQDLEDMLAGAYSSAELIERALDRRKHYQGGERIRFLEGEADRIIELSGSRPAETLLRLTLNRGVDVLRHTMTIKGQNLEEVRRELANFMREDFVLAAALGNNKIGVDSRLTPETDSGTADILRRVSIAEYGRIYASFLWRYSQGLSTDTSKAVLLMRLVGYLGWDLNADLRRREKPIAQTIADIYFLQQSPVYSRLLRRLADGQQVTQAELAAFRSEVFTILDQLPTRLRNLGLQSDEKSLGIPLK